MAFKKLPSDLSKIKSHYLRETCNQTWTLGWPERSDKFIILFSQSVPEAFVCNTNKSRKM